MAISLGQLDLEALKNYLKIVQGFRTVNDPSGDTENVDGVPSRFIATIAEVDGEPVFDRSTVNYALNLMKVVGSDIEIIPSENILTIEEGEELQNTAVEAARNTANDMRSLRNEMYHLKRDMIKSGALAYDPVYDGFIDPFLNGLEVYSVDPLGIDSIDGSNSIAIADGNIDAYHIGEYAAILSQGEILAVEPITERLGSNLTLGNGMFIFNSSPDQVVKSFGVYDKGKYVFANDGTSLLGTENEVNMIYKDGTDRVKVAELNQASGVLGFASTIVVPAELDENYFRAVNLSLRKTGNPGSCYVELYDYNEEGKYGDPIASSNYLNAGKVTDTWQTYKFTFDNEILLNKGHIYLLVIKASGTDKQNMWYVGGFAEQCNYNIHQDTYLYTTESQYKKEGPDIITNQVYDMFMGLFTTETKQMTLNYAKQGIYTGSFELENNTATRVRVSFNPRLSSQYYNVIVKGRNQYGDFVFADLIDKKEFSHIVWANAERSANEFVYDFSFNEVVTYIEFQIVFESPDPVGEQNHEALFAVVVSTDNASLKGDRS